MTAAATGIDPNRAWLTAKETADVLGVIHDQFDAEQARSAELDAIQQSYPVTLAGTYYRRARLYLRSDVDRVRRIMERARIALLPACRVLLTIKREGPL